MEIFIYTMFNWGNKIHLLYGLCFAISFLIVTFLFIGMNIDDESVISSMPAPIILPFILSIVLINFWPIYLFILFVLIFPIAVGYCLKGDK